MPFDIDGARKAGYSDSEIADHLAGERGFDVAGARKSGYDDTEIVKHLSMQATPKPARNVPAIDGSVDKIGSAVQTVAEPIAAMATGTAGQVIGGLAGGAAALIPGLRPGIGKDVVEKVSNALTYEPRSAGGKAVMAGISKPFEWLATKAGSAGQSTLEATGSPLAATVVDTGIQALPMLAGGLISRSGAGAESAASIAARNKAKMQGASKDSAIVNAREAGLAISPEDANAGMIPKAIAGLAGEPKLQKLLSKKNAPVIAEKIKADIGLAEDVAPTRKAIADVRAEAGDAYEAVKGTGTIKTGPEYKAALDDITKSYDTAARDFSHRSENPFQKTIEGLRKDSFDATSAVEEVKLLRSDADKAYRTGDAGLGKAFKSASKALDDEIARHVDSLAAGNPAMKNVATDYLAARERIAKTYAADKALNESNGTFDASVYARELKRGKPLSGGARQVAEFAQAFPRAAQKVERTGSTGPSYFDGVLGAASHVPMLFARPLARHALATDIAQRMIAKPGNYDRSALSFAREEAMRKAGLLGLMGTTRSE